MSDSPKPPQEQRRHLDKHKLQEPATCPKTSAKCQPVGDGRSTLIRDYLKVPPIRCGRSDSDQGPYDGTEGSMGRTPLAATFCTGNEPEIAAPIACARRLDQGQAILGVQRAGADRASGCPQWPEMTACHKPSQASGLAPHRRSLLNICIKISFETTIAIRSPGN
jgi:hypothetical protein